jgi:hypothetical protein
MGARRTAHAELDQFEQRIAAARLAESEAEQALLLAEQAIETARDAVREAHDLGADPKRPTAQLEQAKQDAEQAALAREGIGQRVRRAIADRDACLEGHADDLLTELQPACTDVVAQMRTVAEQLLATDAEWRTLQQQVSRFLLAGHRQPAHASPAQHELTTVVRDLKRALGHDLTSPAPYDQTQHHQKVVA